jgi:hypothetical protein
MTKFLTDRVRKTPPNKVSEDRYKFIKLTEVEPDLGVASGNNYILSTDTQGVRSWIDPTESFPAPGANTQIIFNDSGVLAAANSLIYDSVNDSVGIGTSLPSAKLDVVGDIEVNSNINLNSEATTLATTTKTQIASFPAALFRSGKLIVQAYDSVTGEVHISELLVAHNGTTASATEYGVVHTGTNPLAMYDVDIDAGNVRLLATGATVNSTQYKISETLMVA